MKPDWIIHYILCESPAATRMAWIGMAAWNWN